MNKTPTYFTSVLLNKVPELTLSFWLIKIMSTTVGETGADFLAVNAGLGSTWTSLSMLALLIVALLFQLRTTSYTPWIYWLTVVLVSIVGTQITDLLTDKLNVSLYLSTAIFAVILACIFAFWYAKEGTLSIHTINTRKRELFYWVAILCTFALGTAAGDLATEALGLGFQLGVFVFGSLILLATTAFVFGANGVLTFWIAYILTRPLGASLGDWLSQNKAYGGIGLGASGTSIIFLAIIIVLVSVAQYNTTQNRPIKYTRISRLAISIAWFVTLGLWYTAFFTKSTESTLATSSQNAASSDSPTNIQPTTKIVNSTNNPTKHMSKLGDLSSFRIIAVNVSSLVDAGNFTAAQKRIKDLEISWDSAEAGLKPRSANDWHTIDKAIDSALKAVRSSTPNVTTSKQALTTLIDNIDHLK